jgi:hypothetical protein
MKGYIAMSLENNYKGSRISDAQVKNSLIKLLQSLDFSICEVSKTITHYYHSGLNCMIISKKYGYLVQVLECNQTKQVCRQSWEIDTLETLRDAINEANNKWW